jgi:hypothetical protein
MSKFRKKSGLSLAIVIGVISHAEAGMLAMWLGFGVGSVSHEPSLNTSNALVNHTAFGGLNASSIHVEDNQLSNNSVGAAGIGASSDGFLTAGNGKSKASIDDEVGVDIHDEDSSIITKSKSSITSQRRILEPEMENSKTRLLSDEQIKLVPYHFPPRPESVIMSSEGLIPEYAFDDKSNTTITGAEAVDKCVHSYFNYIKDVVWLRKGDDNLTSMVEPLEIQHQLVAVVKADGVLDIQTGAITRKEPNATNEIPAYMVQKMILQGNGTDGMTMDVVWGAALGKVVLLMKNATQAKWSEISGTYSECYTPSSGAERIWMRWTTENGDEITINSVWKGVDKLMYDAIFFAGITPPKCGLIPDCIHEIGGHTMAYNPFCSDDITWEDTMRFVNVHDPSIGPSMYASPTPTQPFKWDAWKYSAIGLGAATIAFGTVAAVFVVKSVRKCIRSRNEIQIELIDDPALTHTLIPNR